VKNVLFEEIILPIYYRYKRQDRYKYYREFRKANNLTEEQLQEVQWKNLKRLVNHCYKNISYYQRLFREHDIHPEDIKSLSDYAQIPELKKQHLKNHYKELMDPKLTEKDITFSATGGTTGEPMKIYKSLQDQEQGYALRYRSNEWCGWRLSEKAVWFVADLKRVENVLNKEVNIKTQLGNWIRRKLVLDTRDCSIQNMTRWAAQIQEYKPEQIYGYSSLIAEFCRFVVKNNIKFTGIKGVYSTAEPLLERKLISKAFNAPVYDQYGCSEIPCIAHECKHGNMHLNSDWILAEFVDIPNCKDLKRIVCTPLYAYGVPLLRYDVGDIAVAASKKCDCGLNYPVIELKVGRLSDNILAPDGTIVSSSLLGWQFEHAMRGIKQYQVIQKEIDHIHVIIVRENGYTDENENIIRNHFAKILDCKSVRVTFEYNDRILAEKNGKFRTIKSIPLERERQKDPK